MTHKLVSVIITAFNEERFIAETLDSYLYQSYPQVEIIVVNDGSTDKTAAILDNYAAQHDNIKIIHFPENKGKATGQNAAFQQAAGEYIAISGGDDYGCFNRLKTQVDFLEQNNLNFVFSNLYIVDEQRCAIEYRTVYFSYLPNTNPSRKSLIFWGWSIPGGTIMFTKELAQKIYPIPITLPYEDRWFSFIAGIHGKIGYIPEPLGFYRQSNKNSYGIIQYIDYKKFADKWLAVKKRDLIYEEEIKQYLTKHNLWEDSLERAYQKKKALLSIITARDIKSRLEILPKLWKNKLIFYAPILLISELIIIAKFLKSNLRAILWALIRVF